ncbi:MAG: MtrB/PioB family outer membrane beta-barrel protein [Gammaproteobacteria bacterium]|nr:MtrB/PioB family outer membrane beta-barrel protein [Gammaproteobacteria bacterium]
MDLDDLHPSGSALRIPTSKSSCTYPGLLAFASLSMARSNSTTRQLDALLSYAGERLNLSGGYYGSWYDNHKSRLDVIGTAGGYTEMSLPPDNYAHQAYVQGNYRFTPVTRGLFKLSYTHAKQDASFINTNNNGVSAWAPMSTAGSSLQGEVNTTEAMLGVTAHPMQMLSLVAKLNYWDRQDDTPVRIDGQNTAATVFYHNNPFSNTKSSAMAEGTYRLPDGYSATAGLDYLHRKREYDSSIDTTAEFFSPYRTEVDETTYRVGLRRSLSATLNGSLRYSHAERDGSSYVPGETGWNNITPVHIADRKRNMWKLMLDWVPRQTLGVQFTYSNASDSYPDTATQQGGLRSNDAKMWSLDADYVITDDWKLVGWYSRDTDESLQAGVLSSALYQAYLNGKGTTAGLGLQGQVTEAVDTGINVDWTKTTGSYLQVTTASLPAGTVALPDIENKLSRVNLYGRYVIDTHSSIRLDLIREVWKTNDWTWAFSDGTSFSYLNGNTRIVNPWDQSATFVGGRYTYTF